MASDKTLKFYKAAAAPSTAAIGSVWFDTANRLINVKVSDSGDKQWESYSGLQNASWIEASKTLRLVKANGENLDINLSDVASASALTLVDGRLGAVETWKSTADGDITTLKTNVGNLQTEAGKNTAKLADIAEGQTVKAVVDAAVKAEADRAKGIEGGHETRIGALETTVGEHSEAIEALQAAVGEGGDVASQISAEIAKLDATVGSQVIAEGKHVAVEVVEVDGKLTGLTVTENFGDITKAINDEVTRAGNAEAAINEKIGGSFSKDATVAAAIQAAADAAAAAQSDIDAFLVATETDNGVIDTLHEIQKYITEDGEAADAILKRIGDNENAIATLNGNAETAGSVAKAVKDAKDEIYGEIEANEETAAAALTDLDTRVKSLEGLDLSAKVSDFESRIAANETAVSTVDSRIATAKSGAEATAAADATAKANAAEAAAKSHAETKASEAQAAAEATAAAALAVEAAKVAANETAIAQLRTDLTNSWLWEEFA